MRAAAAAAIGSHQIGQRTALLEEDHASKVAAAAEGREGVEPCVASPLNVWPPLLLGGDERFFFRVKPTSPQPTADRLAADVIADDHVQFAVAKCWHKIALPLPHYGYSGM